MADKPRIQDAGQESSSSPEREPTPTQGADPVASTKSDTTVTGPGQLTRDDRGNINWQWADDPNLQADDVVGNTARLRALAPADLTLEGEGDDLAALTKEPVPVRKSPQSGYNPYNSGDPTKQSWKKKRDLRELGRWIALKKRMRDGSGGS